MKKLVWFCFLLLLVVSTRSTEVYSKPSVPKKKESIPIQKTTQTPSSFLSHNRYEDCKYKAKKKCKRKKKGRKVLVNKTVLVRNDSVSRCIKRQTDECLKKYTSKRKYCEKSCQTRLVAIRFSSTRSSQKALLSCWKSCVQQPK